MFPDQVNGEARTAIELRGRLTQLDAERALALRSELAGVDAYMADLYEEIETTRRLYIMSAVLEIASLRAELFGAQNG
jgi:hypothetical protein